MDENRKSQSPIAWLLGQTGDHGWQYVLSVILAVIGVAFSVAPYFVVVGIVQGLMEGRQDFSLYGKAGPHAAGCCPDPEQRRLKEHPGRADRQYRDDAGSYCAGVYGKPPGAGDHRDLHLYHRLAHGPGKPCYGSDRHVQLCAHDVGQRGLLSAYDHSDEGTQFSIRSQRRRHSMIQPWNISTESR